MIDADLATGGSKTPSRLMSRPPRAAAASDPTLFDRILLYDWHLDRWSFLALPVRFGIVAATPAFSIDNIPGSLDDDGQSSLYDPIYAAGAAALGVVTADNRLALPNGPGLEAIVETAEAMLSRPQRALVRGLRLDTDASDWRPSIGSRESPAQNEPVRWRPESRPNFEAVRAVPRVGPVQPFAKPCPGRCSVVIRVGHRARCDGRGLAVIVPGKTEKDLAKYSQAHLDAANGGTNALDMRIVTLVAGASETAVEESLCTDNALVDPVPTSESAASARIRLK